MEKKDILSLSLDELEQEIPAMGEKSSGQSSFTNGCTRKSNRIFTMY